MRDIMMWENDDCALLTDLYQFTMAQSYVAEGMNDVAVFELFFRSFPRSRNYLVFCGLDEVLRYLENLSFGDSSINYLASLGQFSQEFLEMLSRLRFTGDVFAVPEGTVVFANEPVLQVVAPLVEAQLVESYVLNLIHYQTLVASKASRVVSAAAGCDVVDFGMRRTHGGTAAMLAAKAGYIAGLDATSNVLAGKVYGIPVAGTMAHSYVQCHDDEKVAFRDFARLYPKTTLLVDTYDTLEGVRKVVELAESMGDEFNVQAVRIDSGELLTQSRDVRRILDEAGLRQVRIYASGDLDEYVIAELMAAGAPIDGFGMGTRLGVSHDAPYLDSAYKLVEYGGESRIRLSRNKTVIPGRKQVFRQFAGKLPVKDMVCHCEEICEGVPLLEWAMKNGARVDSDSHNIELARQRTHEQVGSLPRDLRALSKAQPGFEVESSTRLMDDFSRLQQRVTQPPKDPTV